jgi:hypothetical protein
VRIELSCKQCGSNHFALDDAHSDASVIFCLDCGHIMGTLSDLKQQVEARIVAGSEPLAG